MWKQGELFGLTLIVACMAVAVWLTLHPQSVGWAIGAFGLVAFIAGNRQPNATKIEKFAWNAVLFLFLVLEYQAIDRSDKDNQTARDKENAQFQAIVTELQDQVAASKTQYDSTIAQVNATLTTTQKVESTSQTNLDEVTGKDSHPCVFPEQLAQVSTVTTLPLAIVNRGKNVLTGVDVMLEEYPMDISGPVTGAGTLTTVGTLAPGFEKPLPTIRVMNLGKEGNKNYTIRISTQNGFYMENLSIRRSVPSRNNPPWAYLYFTEKLVTVKGPTKRYPHIKGHAIVPQRVPDCEQKEWSDGSK